MRKGKSYGEFKTAVNAYKSLRNTNNDINDTNIGLSIRYY